MPRLLDLRRAQLVVLLACTLSGALDARAAAEWRSLGTTPATVSIVGDGRHLLAYQPDLRHVRVLDTAGASNEFAIPDECASGSSFLRSVGGGQLLLDCQGDSGPRPLLFDVGRRHWHEVPGLQGSPTPTSGWVKHEAIGERWLKRTVATAAGTTATWIDWRTGEQRPDVIDAGHIANPDAATLFESPCAGMRLPPVQARAYEAPFGVAYSEQAGLRLERCGSDHSLLLDAVAESHVRFQLADRIVTWTAWPYSGPRFGVHLTSCRVRLMWHPVLGGEIAHAGRTVMTALVPDKYSDTGPVQILRMPAGCPRAAAATPVRLGQAGRTLRSMHPTSARWAASADWGRASASILPGTFRSPTMALRHGATVVVHAASAISLRWSANAGPLHRGRRARRHWSFVPTAARAHVRRLRLALRFPDGGTASYRINVVEPRVRAR